MQSSCGKVRFYLNFLSYGKIKLYRNFLAIALTPCKHSCNKAETLTSIFESISINLPYSRRKHDGIHSFIEIIFYAWNVDDDET
jgi:hypothetical protein